MKASALSAALSVACAACDHGERSRPTDRVLAIGLVAVGARDADLREDRRTVGVSIGEWPTQANYRGGALTSGGTDRTCRRVQTYAREHTQEIRSLVFRRSNTRFFSRAQLKKTRKRWHPLSYCQTNCAGSLTRSLLQWVVRAPVGGWVGARVSHVELCFIEGGSSWSVDQDG